MMDVSVISYNGLIDWDGVYDNGQTLNFSMPSKNGRFGFGVNIDRNQYVFAKISQFNGFLSYHEDVEQ